MSEKPRDAVQRWFLEHRGITPETLDRCKIITTDHEARWKVGSTEKIRTGFGPGEKRSFKYADKGHPLSAFHLPVKAADITDPVIVTEGESDALRLWQAGGKDLYGQISALPGCDAITPEVAQKLAKRAAKTQLYFVLDNEKDAENGSYDADDWKDKKNPVRKVDESWKRIKALLPKARRIYLPREYKDLCEYLDIYSIKDFDNFVVNAEARYNFEALDFTRDSDAEPSWLWKSGLPHGMLGMIQGNGGLGKSWILLGLCVAIAEGWPTFMGLPLDIRKGRAMLVDNENPKDILRHRAHQLGLTLANQKKLRIVSHQVMLDSDGEKLIEDVATFDPDFLGLDSLTSLHSLDESKASQMGSLVSRSVRPIAHDLGVGVFLLHHVNRWAESPQARTRGGEHVANATDVAWDVSGKQDGGVRTMDRFRTRIGGKNEKLFYEILDKEHGRVEVESVAYSDRGSDVL